MSGSSNYQALGVIILRLFFHYCHINRGLFCLLLYWGNFALCWLKQFLLLIEKTLQVARKHITLYSVILRLLNPPRNVHCTELPTVREQRDQSRLWVSPRQRRGLRKERNVRLLENRSYWRTEVGKIRCIRVSKEKRIRGC